MELFWLENTFNIIKSRVTLTLQNLPLNYVPKCHIYTSQIAPGIVTQMLPWSVCSQSLPTLSMEKSYLISNLNIP